MAQREFYGWKVVRQGSRKSVIVTGRFAQKYPRFETVHRRPGYGPLGIFFDENEALSWAINIRRQHPEVRGAPLKVCHCVYGPSLDDKLWRPTGFWERRRREVVTHWPGPIGAGFADWVRLLQ